VQKVLDLVLQQGARLAAAGEFTRRAFLNGRIDLVQAEAVIDIIRGKSEAALNMAQQQREGMLSRELGLVRDQLSHALALCEAYVDFPEEDLGIEATARIVAQVDSAGQLLTHLLDTYEEGRVLRTGVSVVIAGKPNVGKSSLLNCLLREKRAIVTSVPGTTRDIIEEVVNIDGLPVTLLDTAGIRETSDLVEQEGVRLVLDRLPQADLVVFLLDGARPFDDDDRRIVQALAGKQYLVVINKSDLPAALILPGELDAQLPIRISTATGGGVDSLKQAIRVRFLSGSAADSREHVALSRARHRDALVKGQQALARCARGLGLELELELLAADLREALAAIGEVTGETTPDDILDLIFGQFCIGK
jgi:tRNA modification GTPase